MVTSGLIVEVREGESVETTSHRDAALGYGAAGHPVLPVVPGGKEPLTALVPHGLSDATTDAATIRGWWAQHPDASVAIRCDGLVVIDVDPGGDLAALVAEFGDLPETRSQSTPRGGRHLLFRVPAYVRIGNSTKGIGSPVGIDVRAGERGYIVVAPSTNGTGAYRWENTGEIADAPPWLVAALTRTDPASSPATSRMLAASTSAYGHAALDAEANAVRGAAEGGRNNRLNEAAFALGQLAAGGELVEGDAEEALVQAALACGLPQAEAIRTMRSGLEAGRSWPRSAPEKPKAVKAVTQAEPHTGVNGSSSAAHTDMANAALFAQMHGDQLRHIKERRSWYVWAEGRWRRDTTGHAERAAKDTARELWRRAFGDDDATKWATRSQHEPRLRAMLDVAASEPGLALAADDLDRNPFLLACGNGTLDLRTGTLRPHEPTDLISLGTAIDYDPDATCPRWGSFLLEVFDGDAELVAYVRRAIGYMLTGDSREHVVFVFHGAGCNGKSTLVETVKRLLGDLADTAPFESFTRSRANRSPRNDIARLHRSRLVIASESGAGHKLDEATVKNLSGSDTVAARFLYGEFFEFKPQFKIVLVSNHKPQVDGNDDAIWRRIRLIPFHVSFEGCEDRDLAEKLEAELPGILTWAVHGCLEWQQRGLDDVATVMAATREYRAEEDTLGAFIEERCALRGFVVTKELFAAYEEFCEAVGEKPLANSVLGRQLKKRGIQPKPGRNRTYQGISLRELSDDSNEADDGRGGVSVTPLTHAGETEVSEHAVNILHPSSQTDDSHEGTVECAGCKARFEIEAEGSWHDHFRDCMEDAHNPPASFRDGHA